MSEIKNKNQGKLIVFSAPSGSGETTIVRHLLKQEELNLEFSISATSREARGNEIHGKDYYYLSLKEFKNKIKNDEFLEWEEVYRDNFYGTLKTEVERIWALGKHVIFNIVFKFLGTQKIIVFTINFFTPFFTGCRRNGKLQIQFIDT